MVEKKPLYKRTWFIVVVAVLLLSGIGNVVSGPGSSETNSAQEQASASPTPSKVAVIEQSPTPIASETESPLSDPNSEESLAYFAFSSTGQFIDMDKDIDDGIRRAEADQRIRLLGNILELSFNLGQLESLDAPTVVAESWTAGIQKLEASIDAASDMGTAFSAREASSTQVVNALEKVRSQINALAKVVAKVK